MISDRRYGLSDSDGIDPTPAKKPDSDEWLDVFCQAREMRASADTLPTKGFYLVVQLNQQDFHCYFSLFFLSHIIKEEVGSGSGEKIVLHPSKPKSIRRPFRANKRVNVGKFVATAQDRSI